MRSTRKSLRAKSSFDKNKRRSEAAAFFISLKGVNRDDRAIRVNYTTKEKKSNTKGLRLIMALLAAVMAGVLAAGIYFAYQEFQKLGPPSPAIDTSEETSSRENSSSGLSIEDRLVVLGNWNSKIPDSFQRNLTELNGVQVDAQAAKMLEQMIRDAGGEISLVLEQGYLSDNAIQERYDSAVQALIESGKSKAKAEEEAMKSTPPPAQSEWGTGLLIRFQNSNPEVDFSQSAAYQWLTVHCVDYGFVVRYPKNKESETNASFQPQTFRFVGVENAKKMRALDLCMEEYATYIKEQKAGY